MQLGVLEVEIVVFLVKNNYILSVFIPSPTGKHYTLLNLVYLV